MTMSVYVYRLEQTNYFFLLESCVYILCYFNGQGGPGGMPSRGPPGLGPGPVMGGAPGMVQGPPRGPMPQQPPIGGGPQGMQPMHPMSGGPQQMPVQGQPGMAPGMGF